jgi:hypothetical protein
VPTYLPQTFGSPASHAKTSLLHEWENGPASEGGNRASFLSLLDWWEKAAPGFLSSRTCRVYSARTVDETSELYSGRWPNSGILSDGVCSTAKISESPSRVAESSLLGVIETGKVHRRYFLSPNAARGCLRRVERMGRNLFPPLKESLSILAQKDQ